MRPTARLAAIATALGLALAGPLAPAHAGEPAPLAIRPGAVWLIGKVEAGAFRTLTAGTNETRVLKLTTRAQQEAAAPDSAALDLKAYEGTVIMVEGFENGGWVYSAEIIDQATPLLQALVLELSKEQKP